MVDPSVALVIPPDEEAAAAALALGLEAAPVVAVPLFFGRDSTGRARKSSKKNVAIRRHDSYIMKANGQRQSKRGGEGMERKET